MTDNRTKSQTINPLFRRNQLVSHTLFDDRCRQSAVFLLLKWEHTRMLKCSSNTVTKSSNYSALMIKNYTRTARVTKTITKPHWCINNWQWLLSASFFAIGWNLESWKDSSDPGLKMAISYRVIWYRTFLVCQFWSAAHAPQHTHTTSQGRGAVVGTLLLTGGTGCQQIWDKQVLLQ